MAKRKLLNKKEAKGMVKPKLSINNKLKGALGSSEYKGKKPTGRIQINVKKHKGDLRELASTIKHEIMHVKKPKATEKEVYKATAKMKINPAEQSKLLSKLRHKTLNYKAGAIKRKFKMGKNKVGTGGLIEKANEIKNMNPVKRTAFMGMV